MNAIVLPRLCCLCGGAQANDLALVKGEPVCHGHAATDPQITESDAEQSWSDFCRALRKPVFLLADTGFGETN